MDLLKGRAYTIFVSELEKHLTRAHSFFDDSASLTSEQIFQAMTSFHTIKGGAGFFGLHDIAKIAGELERLLKSPDFNYVAAHDQIARSIAALEEHARTMPAPVAPL